MPVFLVAAPTGCSPWSPGARPGLDAIPAALPAVPPARGTGAGTAVTQRAGPARLRPRCSLRLSFSPAAPATREALCLTVPKAPAPWTRPQSTSWLTAAAPRPPGPCPSPTTDRGQRTSMSSAGRSRKAARRPRIPTWPSVQGKVAGGASWAARHVTGSAEQTYLTVAFIFCNERNPVFGSEIQTAACSREAGVVRSRSCEYRA